MPLVTTPTQNFLGKCKEKGCDYVIFATGEDVRQAETFRDVRAGEGVFKVGNNGRFARCTNRHKFFAVKLVKGTYSPDHQCDSRCLNARGWSCTCSCGGANHGRGHVATIVKAASLPRVPSEDSPIPSDRRDYEPRVAPPSPVLKHLGEVGDTIRGEVFVKTVKSLANGSVLYSLRTVNGGNIIKWFVPGHADPGFEVGTTITIRAKVKAHGEFKGAPETVVTYVEEVE